MKTTFLLILIFPIFIFSQHNKQVDYYINSVKVTKEAATFSLIRSKSIESIKIKKKGNGEIRINLKKDIILEKLSQIKYKNINKLSNKIFTINNNFIKKPSEVLIDSTEIGSLEIIKSCEFENQTEKITIIKIMTKSELQKIKDRTPIRIKE